MTGKTTGRRGSRPTSTPNAASARRTLTTVWTVFGDKRQPFVIYGNADLAYLCAFSGRAAYHGTCNSALVMRRGQRFESARRLSFFPAKLAKTESPRVRTEGFVSSTSAVDSILKPRPSRQRCGAPSMVFGASSGLESWLKRRAQAGIGLASAGYYERARG
jgi:hypothetical protein